MPAPRALACLLLASLAAPAGAVGDGPLGVGTPGSFRGLFLEMPLSDARGAGNRGRIDLRWWLANDWSMPTRLDRGHRTIWVQHDAQADALQLSLTAPWWRLGGGARTAGWETTAEVRLTERWGGYTDRAIEGWHGLVGSTNFQRDLHPRNAVSLRLQEEGGRTLVDLHHPQLALGDLVLRTQGGLLSGAAPPGGAVPWALALRADLKLPTGRLALLGGSGGFDAGLGLAFSAAAGSALTVHAQGAMRAISPLPHGFPLQPVPVQWGLDLSLVLRLRGRVALLLEDRVSSPLFRGGWSVPPLERDSEPSAYYGLFKPYNQISGGLRLGELTILFSEDFTPGKRLRTDPGPRWFYDSNSPDVVLGLSWARGL